MCVYFVKTFILSGDRLSLRDRVPSTAGLDQPPFQHPPRAQIAKLLSPPMLDTLQKKAQTFVDASLFFVLNN